MAGGGFLHRVVVHDFSGHPFQVQLARELANRGHDVTHMFCSSFLTPKGRVGDSDEAGSFRSVDVSLRNPFNKYSGGRRLLQEIEYAWRFARAVRKVRPDVIVSANTPLIAAVLAQLLLRFSRIPIVFWQQDVYSIAMAGHLERHGGAVGRFIGSMLVRLEKWLLHTSEEVVVISEDFLDTLDTWDVDEAKVTVVENWAPLDELPVRPSRNEWSRRHGIEDDDIVFLYAGTLGLKHEPSVLLDLARAVSSRSDVKVIVASEGRGATWLERERDESDELTLLPFQPYEELPDMLATADVLMVLLEADAGGFSVPSKVLTYHCAGRAILGAMPGENLGARIIERNGSGVIVEPGEAEHFVEAAEKLIADPVRRDRMGAASRAYAERTFDVRSIADRFEVILASAVGAPALAPESAESRSVTPAAHH